MSAEHEGLSRPVQGYAANSTARKRAHGPTEARLSDVGHGHGCRFPDDACECLVPLFEHRAILAARLAEAEQRHNDNCATTDQWRDQKNRADNAEQRLRDLLDQQRDERGSE